MKQKSFCTAKEKTQPDEEKRGETIFVSYAYDRGLIFKLNDKSQRKKKRNNPFKTMSLGPEQKFSKEEKYMASKIPKKCLISLEI